MNEFHIDVDSISKKPRKNGVSGMMRIKNDAEFIEACVESCLPALDELVIVYNDCTDDSPQIIESLAKKYPEKIKVYHYKPKIIAWNLTEEKAQAVLNGKIASENTLYGYYNYALSKTTCKYVMKIDADQIYFTQKLCHICDLYRSNQCKFSGFSYIAIITLIKLYLFIAIRLKHRFTIFSNKKVWVLYLKSLEKIIRYRKINVSLSGLNIIIGKGSDMPLVPLGKDVTKGVNILPPYNGEGDHPIFRVTNKTYFVPTCDSAYNELNKVSGSVIERLVGIGPIIPAGIFWCHLNSCRKHLYSDSVANTKKFPKSFIRLSEFSKSSFFTIMKCNKFKMLPPSKTVLFDFIHNDMDSQIIDNAIKVNHDMI